MEDDRPGRTTRHQPLLLGKVPPSVLARHLVDATAHDPTVLVGPAIGEDAAAIALPAGVVVAATDPVTLTGRGLGRHAAIITVNDVAVMGVRPRWFLACLLLPTGTAVDTVDEILGDLRRALDDLEVTLVGGHTEVTAAVTQPVLVGQALGHAEDGHVIRTSGARPDDVVVQVGPAPVEGAAVLAAAFPDRLAALVPDLLAAAAGATEQPGIAVVDAALACRDLGATALHDPTEGGLAAGLHEVAEAAGVGVVVDPAAIRWFGPGVAVCDALSANPWATLASGALLATFPADDTEHAVARLRDVGLEVGAIGRVRPGRGVADPTGHPLPWPDRDEVARLLA